jgi:hypothetical protein
MSACCWRPLRHYMQLDEAHIAGRTETTKDTEQMTETRHHHHPDEGPRPPSDHDASIPYWKRAHRDWRLWTAAFFVFVALAVYIVTVDLSLVPRVHPPSLSVAK